jgi:Mg-chelatase subunit ChlD
MQNRTLALLAALTLVACAKSDKPEPSASITDNGTGVRAKGEDGRMGDPTTVVATPTAAASALPATPGDGFGPGHGSLGFNGSAKPPAVPAVGFGGKDGEERDHDDPAAHRREATKVMIDGNAQSIRAGEWDDNANYREFQKFLGSVTQPIHTVDVRARRFLIVRDSEGKAVPHCPVTVTDSAQHSVMLTTTASGRAILFPHAEELTGKDFTATAVCTEDVARTTFSLNDDSDGTVSLDLKKKRSLGNTRAVDIAFVLDTTGSMSEEIASVKSTIQKVAQSLQGQEVSIRIGLVEYKDRTDPFVTKVYPMSSDLGAVSNQVSGIVASGGGDMPEDMNAGLHTALNSLEWNPQAVTRAAFIIGDAPPHLDYQNGADYAADMKIASHRGIQLFTVAASGMDSLGQAVWRQMAAYTGATNLFVLRGGAGPQSTGGGDPIASCGGTQTNYASGNLDQLIVLKIKRELKSLDVDPMKIPGLITDENAKPCDQRIAFSQQ